MTARVAKDQFSGSTDAQHLLNRIVLLVTLAVEVHPEERHDVY